MAITGMEENDSLRKAVSEAITADSIKEALLAEARAQGLSRSEGGAFIKDTTEADAKAAADKAAADAAKTIPPTEPTVFSRTETINGRDFTFEAESASELNEMILNAYRVANAIVEEQPAEEYIDPAVAKAAEEAEIARRAELDLKFRRGELSPTEYLEQSGAINDYLESQGVPVDTLKRTVEFQEEQADKQSWSDAVEQFLKSPAGADWPGGDNNKEMIGLQLQALGLVDAPDKVAALAQAYGYMKSHKMIFVSGAAESPVVANQAQASAEAARIAQAQADADAFAAAQKAQQVQQQIQQQQRQSAATSSSLWSASSGTTANNLQDRSQQKVPAKSIIPSDARPEEIMDAWKEQIVARGQDPNVAFLDAFRDKK